MTTDLFEILGVQAAHGRTFTPADVAPDNTVIISHGLWLRRFGGSFDVIGSGSQCEPDLQSQRLERARSIFD